MCLEHLLMKWADSTKGRISKPYTSLTFSIWSRTNTFCSHYFLSRVRLSLRSKFQRSCQKTRVLVSVEAPKEFKGLFGWWGKWGKFAPNLPLSAKHVGQMWWGKCFAPLIPFTPKR
jgi:hypothetical protein